MAESPTQPILVRDDTVVPTAVGASDPSLTLVEFVDGIGFFLAESFQHDNVARLDALENVSVHQYADHAWIALEHERIALSWSMDHPEAKELLVSELGAAPSRWTPAVFFLTTEEFFTHRESLRQRLPEQVLRAVFIRGAAMPALQAELLRLWTRHREDLERLFVPTPTGRVQPKKETIHITLPPKPENAWSKVWAVFARLIRKIWPKTNASSWSAAKVTVRISLPPKPAVRETIRLELPPRKPPEAPPTTN